MTADKKETVAWAAASSSGLGSRVMSLGPLDRTCPLARFFLLCITVGGAGPAPRKMRRSSMIWRAARRAAPTVPIYTFKNLPANFSFGPRLETRDRAAMRLMRPGCCTERAAASFFTCPPKTNVPFLFPCTSVPCPSSRFPGCGRCWRGPGDSFPPGRR